MQTEWTLKYKTKDVVIRNSSGLSSLNFHRAKWRELNDALTATDWNKILNNEKPDINFEVFSKNINRTL